MKWVQDSCVSYIASREPIGTRLAENSNYPVFSAGHEKHEYTTGCAWPEIEKRFDLALKNKSYS